MHLRGKLRAVMTVRQRRDAGGQAMDLFKDLSSPSLHASISIGRAAARFRPQIWV